MRELVRELSLAVGAASKHKEKEDELKGLLESLDTLEGGICLKGRKISASPYYTDEWAERLVKLRDKETALSMERRTLEEYSENVKSAADKVSFEERVQVVLQKLWGVVSEQGIEPLNAYLSETVSAIFGRDVGVRAEYRFKGKVREANIFIKDTGTEEFVPIELCGGSLPVVVGVLLTMLFIESRKAPKILVLDETLSELADITLEGMLELLSSKGFVVVLASHDKRVLESAEIGRTVIL